MVMEPVLVLAVMACGDAGLRVTLTRVLPAEALAWTAYDTLPGTRSVTGPTAVVAVMVAGAAEKVTSIPPTDERRVARTDDTFWPRIDPAWPVTSIGPDTGDIAGVRVRRDLPGKGLEPDHADVVIDPYGHRPWHPDVVADAAPARRPSSYWCDAAVPRHRRSSRPARTRPHRR
jgi:hypothetical protein